ncbi:UDP-3-O-(3-hydroxymyristoyl) glucosamine N-acyltransferase LpxD [Methylocella silvestris BL2]|uniref:UDP-3-O-(3-hydroxymyristoyl) glucosamine N-acyltransferase LpxD n=1 Tax=Methylocella silvestris (strain DSM 15510 / CIP 108128 / LMG 27833 / NCIMB 13906 / BL2) TaxID=395965 RepID=B8EMP1_METSB|nr:UDP-3-O-(3-hydroxymyristoyl)glucosamine N-acyltransferase [Methylocella silvestris]ACK52720.1 UDP-3-O-(3-hydroxymyristoyl) glucosamine N-acyltransferase LpxD [Methylocella silvestris BL2]
MNDPIFFLRAKQLSLAELVALTGARPADGADLSPQVYGGAPFEEAEPGDVTYFAHPKRLHRLPDTNATACFVAERYAFAAPRGTAALVTDQPEQAFAQALAAMYPSALQEASLFAAAGVNPGASVHPEARLEPGVAVDPGAVIGPRAEIGSGTIVGANSVIGPGVRIGRDCSIGAQVTIVNALIGNRVKLRPGARIGQAGSPQNAARAATPQIGRVIIQDDVEIGANAAIDRGSGRDTVIGEGATIGNLVEIGADVTVGRKCRIGALAVIGGSVEIGDFARIGAQADVGEHLHIGFSAHILPQAGVASDVPPFARYAGSPARPLLRGLRALALVERLIRPKPPDRGRGQ